MDTLFLELKKKVYEELEVGWNISDQELFAVIDQCILEKSRKAMLSIHQKEQLKTQLYNAIKRLDILQELLEDASITEIMINGYEDIFIERNGRIHRLDKQFESRQRLEDIAQRIAAMSNKLINESNPIVDTRLEDGSRVNIVLPPVAMNGPIITIRKFYKNPLTIARLIAMEAISKEAASFLQKAVEARYNIFISGGTGSGKTTFLNALSNFIPKDQRIITIEDSAELQIEEIENLVRLEARAANMEGENEVTIRDLIKTSLRMRPDRIIVGEIRGPEALDMLQAMNTGHDGSLSTGHGNSPKDMLSRIVTMVLTGMDMPITAIEQQIASAIDIIVHLGRLRDKTRKVLEIDEVVGYINGEIKLNPLFRFVEVQADEENLRLEEGGGFEASMAEHVERFKESAKVYGSLTRLDTTLVGREKMRAAGLEVW